MSLFDGIAGYRDEARGDALLLSAAEEGHASSQLTLGVRIQQGRGEAPPDPEAGAKWVDLAARGGFGPAQVIFGLYLERGIGVEKQREAALAWLLLGEENGEEAATRHVERLNRMMPAAERQRAEQMRREFRREIEAAQS